ncbi:MAG: SDR family NAD(P)-dependent oxidoreductase, partial [Pseudomonadota bacterium]
MSATFHDLHGVSVFISGGGAGIGADLTDAFMAQGAKVAFIQRSDASDFCDAMEKKHGMRPHFQACDITDIDALKGAIASAADAHGDIGVLVNNAANDTRHTLEEYGPAEWDASMAVNLRHHFFAAQAVVAG